MSIFPEIQDKLMTPGEAVKKFIQDGSQIALGGFTVNRNPMVIAYEIIRQRLRNLHLVGHSHGQAMDVLIGAGCVQKVEIAYGGNGRFAPTCIRFRRAIEEGKIAFEDYTNFQMSLRFLAGSLRIPFITTKSGLGTDLIRREGFAPHLRREKKVAAKKLLLMQNPFEEKEDPVVILPPLNPDVVIIHSQYVGEDGTIRVKGLTFTDMELAKAADKVIITCEEIVTRSLIRQDPDQNSLPGFLVDAFVLAPFGAHPTACYSFYDYDARHFNLYKEAAPEDPNFNAYLNYWVYGVSSHEEYLERVGQPNLARIRVDPRIGYNSALPR